MIPCANPASPPIPPSPVTSPISSKELGEKSLQATLSAIEIYNKPDFRYREETFAILMCNAWELMLKAKTLADTGEAFDAIVATRRVRNDETGETQVTAKLSRSGNPMTLDLTYLARKFLEEKVAGFSKECLQNLELLVEIRDNAVHLVNGDLALAKKILEIGTASLKNYIRVSTDWFKADYSKYNFFLMPISFFHGFELVQPVAASSQASRRFLEYVSHFDEEGDTESPHHVMLTIQTKVVKGKGTDGMAVRWTNDPSAPAMRVQEEDLLERYPYDFSDLVARLRERYSDFKQDARFFKLKSPLESDTKYCRVRYLDPKNAKSGSKKFFGPETFKVFDLHYKKKE